MHWQFMPPERFLRCHSSYERHPQEYDVEDSELNNASYYGRIFAKSGGIAKDIADVAKEMGVEGVKPIAMNGIANARLL